MASYYERERSPFYWLKIRTPGGVGWMAISSGIKKDAPGALRKIHQRVADETAKENRRAADTSAAFMSSWIPGWIVRHYKNEKSAQRAFNAWAHLSMFFTEEKVLHPEEVSYSLIVSYMQWRTDAEACEEEGRRLGNWNTALTEIRILGSMMQEAVMHGWIMANPCARLRLGRKDVKEKIEIAEERQKVIEANLARKDTPQWLRDSWLVGMKHGARLSETQVPLKRIDLQLKTISFRVKGGKYHTAPLHKDLIPIIERRKEEGEANLVDLPPAASKQWIEFFIACGYDDLSFHCTRVTVITRLARAGATEAKAMEYVGHCSASVHAIYRKLKAKDVAELGDHL